MAASEWIGSIARCTAFGTGALLLHAAVAWGMPCAAPRIPPSGAALLWIEHAPASLHTPIGGSADGAALGLPAPPAASAAPPPRALGALNAARQNRALPNMQVPPEQATAPAVAAAAAPDEAAGAEQAEAAASETSVTGSATTSLSSGAPGSAASGHSASAAGGALGDGAPGAAGVLGHGPALLALGNPCTGYFPEDARADHGEVQLDVTVDASGHAHASAVLAEQPLGQGFASAARDCARRLEFAPAISEQGAPMAGHARLKLRFKRRTS